MADTIQKSKPNNAIAEDLSAMTKKKNPVIQTEDMDKSPKHDTTKDHFSSANKEEDLRKKKQVSLDKISVDEFKPLDEYRITMQQLQQRLDLKLNPVISDTAEGTDMLSKLAISLKQSVKDKEAEIKQAKDDEKAKNQEELKAVESKAEKRERERQERLEKRSKGCGKFIWGVKMFLKLKAGIMFFQYVQTPLDGDLDDDEPIDDDDEKDEAEKEEEKKACSYQKLIKTIVTAVLFIGVFFGVIKDYIDLIGKEKSQKLTYYDRTNLTYDITEIPKVLGVHQFTFFNKGEVTRRMQCLLYDNNHECYEYELERCLLKEQTSVAFENCVITLQQQLNKLPGVNFDSTQFCEEHYGKKSDYPWQVANIELWQNTLNPKYVMYHQRYHGCLETAGVPKGKAFCDDMKIYNLGWSNANLFNCYRSNGVDFSKQYCDDKFDITISATTQTEQNLLKCYADKGLEKGKTFCDLNNKQNDQQTVQKRIQCYDSIPLITKDVCDANQNFLAAQNKMQTNGGVFDLTGVSSLDWSIAGVQECYRALGDQELDEAFCKSYHPFDENTDRVLQTDLLYECYRLVGVPKTTDADKREKCELKFLKDSDEKYACINNAGLRELGDYCYQQFFWEDQYSGLYNCLTSEARQYITIDSTFCEKEYNYLLKKWKKDNPLTSYSDYSTEEQRLYGQKVICQTTNGSIPNYPERGCKNYMEMKDFTGSNFTHFYPTLADITRSKPVKQDPMTLRECWLMEGEQNDKSATFNVKYEQVQTVHSVSMFNLQQGSKASLLAQASIYVKDSTSPGTERRLCAKIEKLPKIDEVLKLECTSEDESPFLGDEIIIESNVPGTMTVCDFKMIALTTEEQPTIDQKAEFLKCADYIDECETRFNGTDEPNLENMYNCRSRYGRRITPEFCVDQHSSNTDEGSNFAYPLTNKYKCLMNNKEIVGKVTVTEKVTTCMNLFYDYLMENCLTDYENEFEPGSITFINSTDEWINSQRFFPNTTEPNDEFFYRAYGPNTISIADKIKKAQDEKAAAEAAILAAQAVQVPIVVFEEDLSMGAIRDYLCSKTDMWFYSNSYNDQDINPSREQDDIVLNMECDVFEFYDPALDENQVAIHYYFLEELAYRKPLKNGTDEDAILFINRTELNQQYFQLEIQKDLEFLTVQKNQMYLREQDPALDVLDVPLVKTEDEYNNFRSEVESLKIYESQDFRVALQEHESTILGASSQVNTYDGVPDPTREMKVKLKVLEIDLAFTKIVDRIIVIEPENNIRMKVELDEEQKEQQVFKTMIGFRFSFTEKRFDYKYYSAQDVLIELGGINGIVGPLLASFTQYFIILFIVDLVRKIRRKSKRDQKQFSRITLGPRLPDYKKCIEKLIEIGPEDDISEILSDRSQSQEIGDMIGKDETQKEGGSDIKAQNLELPQMKKNISKLKVEKVELKYHKKMTANEKKKELKEHLEMVDELIKHLDLNEENEDAQEDEIDYEDLNDEQKAERDRKKEEEEQKQKDLREEEEREKEEDDEARKSGKKVQKRKRKEYTKMSKLVQLEHQYDTLVLMEKIYGKYMKEFGIRTQIGEIFDDYEEVDKYLAERRQITFLKVVELFKKRLSFFGIYSLNDQIELTNEKAIYLRKQLSVVVKLLLQFQDKLINDIEAERKDTVNFINNRFHLLSDKKKFQGQVDPSQVNGDSSLQEQFDGDLKKIHDEVQNIKKEIVSGALQEKMSEVLTKKHSALSGNLKNEIIAVNRLMFEADIYQLIVESYKKIEKNIKDNAQEIVFRDIKKVLHRMRDFAETNSQNVQKVSKIIPKITSQQKESFDLLMRTIDDSFINWGMIQENFVELRGLQSAVWQAIADQDQINHRQQAQMDDEKNQWLEIEQFNDQVNKDMAILMKEINICYEKIGNQQ